MTVSGNWQCYCGARWLASQRFIVRSGTPACRATAGRGTSSSRWGRSVSRRRASMRAGCASSSFSPDVARPPLTCPRRQRSLDRAVDRGASHAKQLGKIGRVLLSSAVQVDHMRLMPWGQLGLPATQPAYCLATANPLAGTHAGDADRPDQV